MIHIEFGGPFRWVLLKGRAQRGKLAQTLIAADLSLPPPKRKPQRLVSIKKLLKNFTQFVFPVIKQVANAPILSHLFSVQPLSGPVKDSPMKFIQVTPEMRAKRIEDHERIMAALRVKLKPGETLKTYKYGGWLSERGGLFVSYKGAVRRYCVTMMS